jgi:glutathione S-transferase
MKDKSKFDEALRCALTRMISPDEEIAPPAAGSDVALRYLRDRISVPRDMSIWAARRLKTALEETAALVGPGVGPVIPVKHRRDQDPANFGKLDNLN